MSSPHYIVVPYPKPPVRHQHVPAGDGLSILLISSLVLGVILWRPKQKKEVGTPVPENLLARVNPKPQYDPFGYRVTA